jgi:ATP-dependent protease ClpP protease subunit
MFVKFLAASLVFTSPAMANTVFDFSSKPTASLVKQEAKVVAGENSMTAAEDGTVVLRGVIEPLSGARFLTKFFSTAPEGRTIFIDSPGGSVQTAKQIVAAIRSSAHPVRCVANFAASAAFLIFQACHERIVTPASVLMQHEASFSAQGEQPNVESFVGFVRRQIDELVKAQAKRMKMSETAFKKNVATDWWFTSGDALEHKAADKMLVISCTKEMAERKTQEKISTMFGEVEMVFSGCPMISAPVEINIGKNNVASVPQVQYYFLDRNPYNSDFTQFIKKINKLD